MIPYGRQYVDDDDIAAVVDILRGDWLTTGPAVERFEEALQQWTGGTPAVAVSSGTAALHAAYAGAGIGRGDEVITPPITFVATQAALVHLGAVPVFADVEEDTATIDSAAAAAAVTSRTKAIVAVDYAGHPADMTAIRQVAERHGLLVIEDAAHSLGSTYEGRFVGSLADVTTFSFYPTKNITTAEGGAVASPHADLLTRTSRFARQGLVRDPEEFILTERGPWHQEVHDVGLNYRLSDMHAALGLSQLSKLSAFKARRAAIKAVYDDSFRGLPGVDIPVQRPEADPVWHLYPLRVPAPKRRDLFVSLRREGIGVQVNYLPAYRHPALTAFGRPEEFPVSEEFYAREISLPMHAGLGNDDLDKVIQLVTRALAS
jgi:dTDP-4-amino-4,6-dideoxygalactose transaminase